MYKCYWKQRAKLKTPILQVKASLSQQGTKFTFATTPSGLVNLDSFKTVSSCRKSLAAGLLGIHPALQAEEETEERSLFLGECSNNFATTYVRNPNTSVSSLHKADHPTFWEAQQGLYWAQVTAQEHGTHQTADSLLKKAAALGKVKGTHQPQAAQPSPEKLLKELQREWGTPSWT